ncbi:hypothetical protein K437DRAFT_231744 [Tilletiaria anomala UBC 951]|uniref:t-SNARE coiled-coil homology domain-containing protein n=1 Tax=Tilletiaria anomala (strain ATCC 24038 / CBS 436.72 / UBC 951) TaxID=1037660 RepID=A0A066WFV1_TILAU|nr:uncharacterized protein K437DRAFT_231744 [Tilletiaria anomala UBC 951]KDN52681.1 hypothetical protein K437DRAFT_231744 [Tilletiaria anomala UBC 951]
MGLFKKNKNSESGAGPAQGSGTGYQARYNPPPNPGSRNLPPPGAQQPGAAGGWHQYNQPYGAQNNQYGGGYGGANQRDSGAPNGYGTPAGGDGGSGYGTGYGAQGRGGYSQGSHGGHTTQAQIENEYGAGSRQGGYGGGGSAYDEYGPSGEQQDQQQQEERTESDEEVEAVKQQMRFTKQESLSATRNALRMAREAEETATNSMMRLGDQSEKLADTERNLDLSKAYAGRADDNAKEIVALNRSIFRPNIQFDKKAKRAAEEARIINRHVDEREEREALRAETLAARNRVDQSLGAPGSGAGGGGRFDRFAGGRFGSKDKDGPLQDAKATKLAQRSRYQFEATASDDELEDELDENLDEISRLSGRLNQLGRAMGGEIDAQNERLRRLQDKTTNLDTKVFSSTQRLGNIK